MWTAWRHLWRTKRGGDTAVSVVEWRDDGVLALRADPHGAAGPEVLAACFIPCAPTARGHCIAQLKQKCWFRGPRNLLMLGVRQRQLTLLPHPTVPDAELAEAARWQLQDALDYPPEEAVLDVLRLCEDEPPARQQIAVFSVRRSELDQLTAPFGDHKIKLEGVDVADCAQRNLTGLHAAHGRPLAMLSWREDSILFSVSRASEVLLSRSFDASKLGADAADVSALAERVGLQLQRMLDALERRASTSSPAQILVLDHPGAPAALLNQTAELTGLRVMPLELAALMNSVAAELPAELSADFLHLLGAALRPAPLSKPTAAVVQAPRSALMPASAMRAGVAA